MIVIGLPKQGGTRKVRCPFCSSRLCDAVTDKPDYKISVIDDFDSNIIIKCHKCGRLIGISIVLSKVKNHIQQNIGT